MCTLNEIDERSDKSWGLGSGVATDGATARGPEVSISCHFTIVSGPFHTFNVSHSFRFNKVMISLK